MANTFCVTITESKSNGDKATVGFVVANAALGSDKDTMVFLSADGVWAAVKGEVDKIVEGEPFAPLKDLVEKFTERRRQDPGLLALHEKDGASPRTCWSKARRPPAGPPWWSGWPTVRPAWGTRDGGAGRPRPGSCFRRRRPGLRVGPGAAHPGAHAPGARGRCSGNAERRDHRGRRPAALVPHGGTRISGLLPGESAGQKRFFVRKGAGQAAQEEAKALEEDKDRARQYEWRLRARASGHLKTTVYCRNFQWDLGQPASFEEKDAHPSAVEAVLGALAGDLVTGFATAAAASRPDGGRRGADRPRTVARRHGPPGPERGRSVVCRHRGEAVRLDLRR